jgi:hypothetical protein
VIGGPGPFRADLLYLVVFGPGYGESVMLRVPDIGWVIVDSLRLGSVTPALELLDDLGEPWAAIALTHPHRDHYRGIESLLHRDGGGPVGLTQASLDVLEASLLDGDDQGEASQLGGAAAAIDAMESYWDAVTDSEWPLESGQLRRIGDHLCIEPLWPTPAYLDAIEVDTPPNVNYASCAMLVTWHRVRLVLGADLPIDGWTEAITVAGVDVGEHAALKVPHHGSLGSLHPALLAGDRERRWLIAPYRAAHLPRCSAGEGGRTMLGAVRALSLSAPPAVLPADVGASISCGELGAVQEARHIGVEDELPDADRVRRSWTLVGLNSAGDLVETHQGDAALTIH